MLMPEFTTVKQPPKSKLCGACMAAMAVGKTLDEVLEEITLTPAKDGRPFVRTRHLLAYLGCHGIICGLTASVRDGYLFGDEEVDLHLEMKGWPMVLTVPSENIKNASHYIFWDGNYIRDPDPNKPELIKLREYKPIDIMPLTYLDETLEETH